MTPADVAGDVNLTGDQIPAFCDMLVALNHPQRFDLARLRTAERITRTPSLGQTEWRVTLEGKRGIVVLPIAGV